MRDNPFRRLRQAMNLSQRGVPGLSRPVVEAIELGSYESLSDKMLSALYDYYAERGQDERYTEILSDEYGTPYLEHAYTGWRKAKRALVGADTNWPRLAQVEGHREIAPMQLFAELSRGSVRRFCRDLCLQWPTVDRYIKGKYDYLTPPASLDQALTDSGYDYGLALFDAHRNWLEQHVVRTSR